MHPLSLAERGIGPTTVSAGALLTGVRPPLAGTTSVTLTDYTNEILASGFPGIRHLQGRALRAQLDGYIERIVDRDFEEQGQQSAATADAASVDESVRSGDVNNGHS